MSTTEQVTLTHPKLPGATYTCPASQAWVWEAAGWRIATDPQRGAAQPQKTTTAPAAAPAKDTKES